MKPCRISKTLMKRLPLYLNYLRQLPEETCNISATAIANALGLGEVQVRKDLAKVSGEGRCRTGRSRDQLVRDIEEYLSYTSDSTSVIVGAGSLGEALLDYSGFDSSGVNVMACFDLNPTKKRSGNGKPFYSITRLESFCKRYDVRIGIIAVPQENAQDVCDNLVACGIRAIWNFSSASLKVPQGILLKNENLAASGSSLHMQLKNLEASQTGSMAG